MTTPDFGEAWEELEDAAVERVLGTALLSQSASHMIPELLNRVAPEDFADAHLGEMWTAAKAITARKGVISKRTLLAERDTFPIREHIKNWAGEPVHPMRVNEAARRVVEIARSRRLVEALIRIAQYTPEAPSYSEALEFATTQISGLSEAEPAKDAHTFADALDRWWEWLEAPREHVRTISTPWADLDDMLAGGLHAGRSYVVGGRPGEGKSLALMNMATHAAERGHPVVVFSVEMGEIEVVSRILASGARAEYGRITRRNLDDHNRTKIAEYADTYGAMPLTLIDKPDVTTDYIAAQCRTLKRKHGLDVVVVDYLQLLRETDSRQSRERQVAQISRAMKLLARELDVAVIVACQLNRNAANAERRPQLSELRESGAIEQDCDVAILLHHEIQNGETTGEVTMCIAKNRTGKTGAVSLPFRAHQARLG